MPTTFIDINCFDRGVAYNRNLVLSVLYKSLVFKLAILTYKIKLEYASTSAYISYHVRPRESICHLLFFNHTAATQTDYQNSFHQPRVPILCSCRLELFEH